MHGDREIPALSIISWRGAIRRGACERRRSGRAGATGTAIVHRPAALHGRIIDLSIGGVGLLVEGAVAPLAVGDLVDLSIRLDEVGPWFRLGGAVVRIDTCGLTTMLAIELFDAPQGFEDLVQSELLSMLECACDSNAMLVDGLSPRHDVVSSSLQLVTGSGRRTREQLTVDRSAALALRPRGLVATRELIGACA